MYLYIYIYIYTHTHQSRYSKQSTLDMYHPAFFFSAHSLGTPRKMADATVDASAAEVKVRRWDVWVSVAWWCHGDSMGFQRIWQGFTGIWWDFMGFSRGWWDLMGFNGIYGDFMGIWWDFNGTNGDIFWIMLDSSGRKCECNEHVGQKNLELMSPSKFDYSRKT